MRQLLQNETENSYYKLITKCDRGLLQNASGITKVYQVLQSVTDCHYKVHHVLQSVEDLLQSELGITKDVSYLGVIVATPSVT